MARGDHGILINQAGQQFKTRIPDDLHSRLKDAAKANGRSANAEIVNRLEASFEAPRALADDIARFVEAHVEAEVQRRLREIAAKIGGAA